jgi:alkanesulfonate monooxygenase SsuD/methylene tetrahydromethanopterin reductase-like flavin-dependent oxidoreductase (luciferase family)
VTSRAEAAGFELALEWEFFHRHAFVRLAAVAAATTRIRIGTGIANAFTRSPLLHVVAALDLDELSGGRMVLGLGSATRRMNEEWWGVPFSAPAERMEELCQLVRAAFAATGGGGFAFSGKHWKLRIPAFARPNAARAQIPLWVAAVNRGMGAAAGRAADGLLGHPLATRRWHREVTLPTLATAAEGAGRASCACALIPIVVTSIDADPRARARREAAARLLPLDRALPHDPRPARRARGRARVPGRDAARRSRGRGRGRAGLAARRDGDRGHAGRGARGARALAGGGAADRTLRPERRHRACAHARELRRDLRHLRAPGRVRRLVHCGVPAPRTRIPYFLSLRTTDDW